MTKLQGELTIENRSETDPLRYASTEWQTSIGPRYLSIIGPRVYIFKYAITVLTN